VTRGDVAAELPNWAQ